MKRYEIPGTGHVQNAIAPPTTAASYFGKSGTRNWEPALLWLVIAVVALNTIRTGSLPSGQEAVTWVGLSAGVVVAGAFAPGIVAALLVGLLIAGALGASDKIGSLVDHVNANIAGLGKPS
jgi:hypothetical protein